MRDRCVRQWQEYPGAIGTRGQRQGTAEAREQKKKN